MPHNTEVGKYFVQNFGCRATQADGAALESLLSAKGLEAAGERASADLVVLNTCTVTRSADDDVRQTIRRVHRENPAARILVTGCYAQRAPHDLAALPGVEWVVGNSHKTADRRPGDDSAGRSCTLPRQHPCRRYLRAARVSFRARGGRRRRPHAAQFENPGRLQQPLLLLHHPVRARAQPQRPGRAGDPTGARSGGALSRSGAQRHQPGPLGPRTGRQPAPGRSDSPSAGGNRNRAAASQLGRADGFLRRPAGPDGRLAAHRPARTRAPAIGMRPAFCGGCIASTGRATMPTASSRRAA